MAVSFFRVCRRLLILLIGSTMLIETLCKESSESKGKGSEHNLFNVNNNTPLLGQSCITADDLTVFQARRHFQQMLPKEPPTFAPLNDAKIMQQIEFFNQLENSTIKAFDDHKTRELMLIAFADAYGSYMFGYFVPVLKYSYYGGFVSHFAAYEALRLLTKYQKMLGTNGSGRRTAGSHWQVEDLDPSHFFTELKPLADEQFKHGEHNCHHLLELPLGSLHPYVEIDEDSQEMLLISLPYVNNGSVHNPKSKRAARVVLNYYIEIVQCFSSKKEIVEALQQSFAEWVASHTKYILAQGEITLYPAFEAVLQAKKSAENWRKHVKKDITTMNKHLLEDDGTTDQDSDEVYENADEQEMSTLQKLSIWIGCSLAVLLVVYIIFKMQQNRTIITNNRFTKRRSISSDRRRRSTSKRRLSREVSEEDELTVFDRLEADASNDAGARSTATGRRKFSIARFIQRIKPRSWKTTAKGYKSVEVEYNDLKVEEPASPTQQRKPKEDHPQPGTSGSNKNHRTRSCSCISCFERESLHGLDSESNRPQRTG